MCLVRSKVVGRVGNFKKDEIPLDLGVGVVCCQIFGLGVPVVLWAAPELFVTPNSQGQLILLVAVGASTQSCGLGVDIGAPSQKPGICSD